MNDPPPPTDLEKMLRQLTPANPSPALDSRIAAALERTPARSPTSFSLPDRFLLATLAAGVIAACLIVTFLTLDYSAASHASPAPDLADAPTVANTQRILAQLNTEKMLRE